MSSVSPEVGNMPEGEASALLEFSQVFPRRTIRDAFENVRKATGVDFYPVWSQGELQRESVEGDNDLAPFFRSCEGRRFYVHESESKGKNLLLMEEKTVHGTVVAVFDFVRGDPYWREVQIKEEGGLVKRKFNYLRLRFAGVVPETDLLKPHDKKEMHVLCDQLYQKPGNEQFVGVLTRNHKDFGLEGYDVISTRQSLLVKDVPSGHRSYWATPDKIKDFPSTSMWLPMALLTAVKTYPKQVAQLIMTRSGPLKDPMIQLARAFIEP